MCNKKKLKNKSVKKIRKNLGYQPPDWKAFKNTWALPQRVSW
jgi:hypothetical protein